MLLESTPFRCLVSLAILLFLSSCVAHKELVNFKPLDPVSLSPQEILNAVDLTVQPEDLLRIQVSSLDPAAAEPFNLPEPDNNQRGQGGGDGTLQLELTTGYFVDVEGYIDFPVLGPLHVEGMTLFEVKHLIVSLLSEDYLRSPVINIRYLNLKVTLLGEVNSPGLVRLSNKRVTVLEAIGLAGDLTEYANRTNILIMREEEGKRTFERLDLQKGDIFNSPYYYLQQNDVIYVEPITARIATVQDPGQRLVRYVSAGLSLVSIIIALATR